MAHAASDCRTRVIAPRTGRTKRDIGDGER
jgi:hypothetical protein